MMLVVPEIIRKKRDGEKLSVDEIGGLIRSYIAGDIPDYQISALLMAIYFRGLDAEETGELTRAMMCSGELLTFDYLPESKVDKHSTGGVGDKTSLVIAPAVAACGLKVPMISGRGLGFTGGTLDKLEAIPGFQVRLDTHSIRQLIEKHGLALVGQTDNLVPADKRLYALRDVTATVESIPLIVASIMSKKLAEGIDALVLDVKTGHGAFMKTFDRARALAEALVDTGRQMGKRMAALITNMDQPLGNKVGNALEVEEVLAILRGEGPADLIELCRLLSAYMLWLGRAVPTIEEGKDRYDRVIASGQALRKFRDLVSAQGGDPRVVDQPELLPRAGQSVYILSPAAGYVASIPAGVIGWAAVLLGAGRMTVQSAIDPAAGIIFFKKVGDSIEKGERLCELRFNSGISIEDVENSIRQAIQISPHPPLKGALVLDTIE